MGRSLTTLALLIAAVLAAALLVPAMTDWEDQRATIETRLAEVVGGPVELAGPVSVRLLPSPRLTAARVSFEGTEDRLRVEDASLHAELALWPLFASQVVVTQVALEGGDIRLAGNAESLRALADEFAARMSIGAGAFNYLVTPGRLILNDSETAIVIENAQLAAEWAGGDTPVRLSLSGGNGWRTDTTFRPQTDGMWRVNLRGTFGDELAVLSVNGLLQSMDAGSPFEGDFALTADDMNAVLGLADEGPALSLRGPFQAAGSEWMAPEAQLTIGTMQAATEWRARTGARLELTTVLTTALADLDALGFEMAPVRDLVFAAGMRGAEVRLPNWLQFDFGIFADGLVLNERVARDLHAEFQVTGGNARLGTLRGRFPGATEITFAPRRDRARGLMVESGSLRSLMSWLGVDVSAYPEGKLQALDLDLAISEEQNPLRLSVLSLDLDGGHGEGVISLDGAEGTVATMAVTGFDLDAYAPETGGSFVSRLRTFAGLVSGTNATEFNLSGERVHLAGSAVDRFRFAGVSLDGALNIQEAEMVFANGGSLSARGRWAGEGAPFDLQVDGVQVDPGLFDGLPIAPTEQADLSLHIGRSDIGAFALEGNIQTQGLGIDLVGNQLIGGDEQIYSARMIARGQERGALAGALGLDVFAVRDGAQLLDMQWLGPLSEGNLTAHLELAGLSVLARGTASEPFSTEPEADLAVEFTARSPSDLIVQLGGPEIAALENVITTGTGRLRSGNGAWIFTTEDTRIGGNPLTANLQGGGERPLSGAITLEELTWGAGTSEPSADEAAETEEDAGTAGTLAWSTTPFGLDWMAEARADLEISVSTLVLGAVTFKDVALHLTAEADGITIDQARGSSGGGLLSGSAEITRDEAALVISSDIAGQGMSAQDIFAAAGLPRASGPLTLAAQLHSRGRSPFDLIAGLEGRLDIGVTGGALDTINMGHLQTALSNVRTRRALRDAANQAVTQGSTGIARLDGVVPISRGVFSFTGLSGVAETGALILGGALDLRSNIVDVEATFQITDPEEGPTPVIVAFRGAGDGLSTSIDITALQEAIEGRLADTPQGLLTEGDLPEDLQELLRDYENAYPEGEGTPTSDDNIPAQTP